MGFFECNGCGRSFDDPANLVEHIREGCLTPIPEMMESTIEDDLACVRCKQTFYSNTLPCGVLGYCPYKVKRND